MKELVVSQDSNGDWKVTCDKIPGYIATGKTQQEAIEKIKTALSLYFPCGNCRDSE